MKKIIFLLFFISFSLSISNVLAKIVEIQQDEKTFGDWKVYCETDIMMDNSHCKIATKFYENNSVITIEPTAKFFNQLFIVVPNIKTSSFVKIRIDKNDLILSDNIKAKDFGLVRLDDAKKNILYGQMKDGDFLFLRFSIKGSDREVTTKIDLNDFREALNYYNSRVFR